MSIIKVNQLQDIEGDNPINVSDLASKSAFAEADNVVRAEFTAADAAILAALNASNGTTVIGYGNRTLNQKLGEHVSCKDAPFNAVGDGVADDTAALQAFFDYLASQTSAGPTTSGSLSTSYTGTAPIGYFPKGTYKISAKLNVGSYVHIVGDSAIVKQVTDTADIFDVALYQFRMTGMQFVGGRRQLVLSNANINSSMIQVDHCQFFLSRGFSVYTFATGGVWTHLSANATFSNCRWISCNQIMNNCCDSMLISECWAQADKVNLTPSTASFVNRGAYPGDLTPQTRMRFVGGFFIPAVGEEGVDRVANVRWIDNYGSFHAIGARFGGEYGGMQIVAHLGATDNSFPWNTTEVVFDGCTLFAGPDARTDSCVLAIQNQIPNHFRMVNCSGPVGKPIILNLSSLDIAAYMTAFETATGKKAYEYFKVDIQGVVTDIRAYSPVRSFIPDALYPYLVKGRHTRLRKQTQSLANGFAANMVSFSTVEFDTVGAFAAANPTRFVMPAGCSKMQIEVDAIVSVDGAAKTFAVHIDDQSGNHLKGVSQYHGINPGNDQFHFTATVYGAPGSYWTLNIRHNAAAALNLVDCRVVLTPLDMII